MKSQLLFVFLLSISLFSCGSESSIQDNSDTSGETISQAPKPLSSSQKKAYEEKLAAKENSFPTSQALEKGKVNPVDEAPLDTSLFLFREKLIDIVGKKDLIALLALMDENVKVSFGDAEEGTAGFVSIWQLDSPSKIEQSPVWGHLETVLNLGGQLSPDKQSFYAPYIYSSFPTEFDPFEYSAITGSGVRIREDPSLNSRILKSLSYDVVKIRSILHDKLETIGGESHPWVKVQIPDTEVEGFVYGKYLRSPIDYRLGMSKEKGSWQITFFVAGD